MASANKLIEQRVAEIDRASVPPKMAEGELDGLIEGFSTAQEHLEKIVYELRDLMKKVKAYDNRIAGNMNAYMIPHIEAWTEDKSHGGGNTIPEIIDELEDMN
jgi:hypothetical protein